MSAWPDLKKQIAVELESLNRLVDVHRELLVRCRSTSPSAIEISALSALLHSFYTGVENLFKRVALALDDGLPRSEGWHMRLLDRMAEPGARRPAMISGALRERLHGYLAFRHVFRHAYTYELRWTKMAALALDVEDTLRAVECEAKQFRTAMDAGEIGQSADAPRSGS